MRTFQATDLPSKITLCFMVLLIVFTLQSTGCSKKAVEAEPMIAMQAPVSKLAAAPMPLSEESVAVPDFNTEEYDLIRENSFKDTIQNPLSTFSIDVDTASYSNIRRFISMNRTPSKDAVRIEEMINYFDYDYPEPADENPFSLVTEVGPCPWEKRHRLVHIGLQGKSLNYEDLKPANLVFLNRRFVHLRAGSTHRRTAQGWDLPDHSRFRHGKL